MLHEIDLKLLLLLTQFQRRFPDLDAIIIEFTDNDIVKSGLLVALLWWFWSTPHPAQTRRQELVIAGVAGAILSGSLSRRFVDLVGIWHQRPVLIPELHLIPAGVWEVKESAFPSDHAAFAFALVTCLYFISRRVGLAMAAYVLMFVCLPRLYLGIHWPSDIAGGIAIGIGVMSVLQITHVRAILAAPVFRLRSYSPPAFHVLAFLMSYGVMTKFYDVRQLAGLLFTMIRHLASD